jgi:hypothetical protein
LAHDERTAEVGQKTEQLVEAQERLTSNVSKYLSSFKSLSLTAVALQRRDDNERKQQETEKIAVF